MIPCLQEHRRVYTELYPFKYGEDVKMQIKKRDIEYNIVSSFFQLYFEKFFDHFLISLGEIGLAKTHAAERNAQRSSEPAIRWGRLSAVVHKGHGTR